jgi:hypothetical protein
LVSYPFSLVCKKMIFNMAFSRYFYFRSCKFFLANQIIFEVMRNEYRFLSVVFTPDFLLCTNLMYRLISKRPVCKAIKHKIHYWGKIIIFVYELTICYHAFAFHHRIEANTVSSLSRIRSIRKKY